MVSRTLLAAFFIAVIALLSSGCERQPDEQTLQNEIAELIEQDLGKDLFEIVSLRRLGSASFTDKLTGDQRKTVYFNMQLRFRQAIDLTAWDSLNGASIAFLLGATEKGIDGIAAGGNKVGDVLRIHGSRVYALRQGQWRPLPTTRQPTDADKAAETQRLIARIEELAERSAARRGGTEQAIIDKELRQSLKRIERALDQQARIFSAASGPLRGAYNRYIQALADNPKSLGFQVRNYATQGSVENCLLVQSGAVDVAIAQSNFTAQALAGSDLFRQHGALSDLRAVTALFPEYVQIVVSSKSGIDSIEALKGKRVDLGLPESGSRVDALRLLEAAKLKLPDFAEIREAGLDASVSAMRTGELDAFFTTLQAPGYALQNLLARGEARLLSVPLQLQQEMQQKYGVYRPAELAANTYPGQREAIGTLAVTATLIVRADLPDARVEQLLNGLFKSVATLARDNLRITLLSARTAREGITIPLHAAAEHYFSGLEKDRQE
ncbi:MAG: TAXI family TRAP transporter solute-binding subunit [Chromatiales bacterium]|jgi:TRAP transporter TAXI family solute receptor